MVSIANKLKQKCNYVCHHIKQCLETDVTFFNTTVCCFWLTGLHILLERWLIYAYSYMAWRLKNAMSISI